MELALREAKARLCEPIVAVRDGERVTITKHGRPVQAQEEGLRLLAVDRRLLGHPLAVRRMIAPGARRPRADPAVESGSVFELVDDHEGMRAGRERPFPSVTVLEGSVLT